MTADAVQMPLIAAFQVAPSGAAQPLSWPLGESRPAAEGYQWIHLQHGTADGDRWLRDQSGLPEYAVEALLDSETQPRCAKFDGGMLVILRGVNLNPGADPEDMVSIRMWVEPNRIVSVRLRRLMAVTDMRKAMEANQAPPTVGSFLADLSERLTARIDTVVLSLTDEIDVLEEEMLADIAENERARTSELRRKLIVLRRYIAPQRDALSRLAAPDDQIMSTKERIEIRETQDMTSRLVEELDAARERAGVISDQLMDRRSEEMNRNMMVLSVVAAIFLPLGFLTGLLGINVGGMPGAENDLAFWIVCALLGILTAMLVGLFRYLRWL